MACTYFANHKKKEAPHPQKLSAIICRIVQVFVASFLLVEISWMISVYMFMQKSEWLWSL